MNPTNLHNSQNHQKSSKVQKFLQGIEILVKVFLSIILYPLYIIVLDMDGIYLEESDEDEEYEDLFYKDYEKQEYKDDAIKFLDLTSGEELEEPRWVK